MIYLIIFKDTSSDEIIKINEVTVVKEESKSATLMIKP